MNPEQQRIVDEGRDAELHLLESSDTVLAEELLRKVKRAERIIAMHEFIERLERVTPNGTISVVVLSSAVRTALQP